MRYVNLTEVIRKCYYEEKKIDKSEMTLPEKRFYNKLDKDMKLEFKKYLQEADDLKDIDEKALIAFVMNFISEINGNQKNFGGNIFFD